MTENEFILADRIQKIKSTVEKYGEENFYISFSGGKDSTALSALIDMALPNNKIPRVYANTGIEYRSIVNFVKEMANRPHKWKLVIIQPEKNIRKTLEEYGYPFKNKIHAKWVDLYQRNGYTQSIENYIQGDKKDKVLYRVCPQKLLYQFSPDFKLRLSDKCCLYMKEKPMEKWKKENHKSININGIMRSEGGRRARALCLAFRSDKPFAFQPFSVITAEWERWFIEQYNIDICELYKPPYNLERTGCKGCPFALHLQEELDTLEKFFPEERKQCELIWKPVYEEYRRIGYRLKPTEEKQLTISDWMKERSET